MRRRHVVGLLALVGIAAVFLTGTGYSATNALVSDGGAWLLDLRGAAADLLHANGASGSVDNALRDLADGDVEVVQGPEGVFVVDPATGEVVAIDTATLSVGARADLQEGGETVMALGGDRAFVLDIAGGTVQQVDPITLEVLHTAEVGSTVVAHEVDDDGRLWLLTGEGDLRSVTDGALDRGVHLSDKAEDLGLSLVDGDPVVFDGGAGTATLFATGRGGTQEPIRLPGARGRRLVPQSAPTDGPFAFVVVAETGTLVRVDLQLRKTATVGVVEDEELQGPLVHGTRVYVPSFSSGGVFVFDVADLRRRDRVEVMEGTGRFDIVVSGGKLWLNQRDGRTALSVAEDGTISSSIDKGERTEAVDGAAGRAAAAASDGTGDLEEQLAMLPLPPVPPPPPVITLPPRPQVPEAPEPPRPQVPTAPESPRLPPAPPLGQSLPSTPSTPATNPPPTAVPKAATASPLPVAADASSAPDLPSVVQPANEGATLQDPPTLPEIAPSSSPTPSASPQPSGSRRSQPQNPGPSQTAASSPTPSASPQPSGSRRSQPRNPEPSQPAASPTTSTLPQAPSPSPSSAAPSPAPAPNQPPTAQFNHSCIDLTCEFTSTSTDGDGSILTTEWDFGDGAVGSGGSIAHTYEPGAHTVTLTITDDRGAASAASEAVSVRDPEFYRVGAMAATQYLQNLDSGGEWAQQSFSNGEELRLRNFELLADSNGAPYNPVVEVSVRSRQNCGTTGPYEEPIVTPRFATLRNNESSRVDIGEPVLLRADCVYYLRIGYVENPVRLYFTEGNRYDGGSGEFFDPALGQVEGTVLPGDLTGFIRATQQL